MNSAWHGNEDIMAEKVDYGTLKKGGFMRQKQKNNFSLRLAVVGGYLTAENLTKIAEVAEKYGDGHVHLTSRQGVEIPFINTSEENFHISSNSALQDVRTTVLRQRRMMLVSRALLMLSGLKTNVLAVVYVRRPVVQVQSQCRMARLQLIMTNVITAADALNPVQQMRGTHLLHISFHLQVHLVIL